MLPASPVPETSTADRLAFTLVELVVIVLLIGILAAVAAPRIVNQSELTRERAAATVVDNVRRAVDAYFAEHGQFPPDIPSTELRGVLQNPYDPDHPNPVFIANDADHIYPTHMTLRPGSTFWYNRANGCFTARVPPQVNNAETIALFNRINDTNVTSIGQRK